MDKYVSVPEETLADFKEKIRNSLLEQKPAQSPAYG
jgi:hypothetical protein